MSILGRLSNLARGYYKTLQSGDPPEVPHSELEGARQRIRREPEEGDGPGARAASPAPDAVGEDPDVHRHPPTPRPRKL